MRVAIIGCGSLGLLWATKLLKTRLRLVLFARTKEQSAKINRDGITLRNYQNELEHYSVQCESTSFCNKGHFDVVLVAVKQTHLTRLIPLIQMITHPASQIIFLQNGLGHEEKIRCLYNRSWTYVVITTEGALRCNPTMIHHTGIGESWIGQFPEKAVLVHPLMKRVIEEINELGVFKIRLDDFIHHRMWRKFLLNCVINPITAVDDVRNGELCSSRYTKRISRVVFELIQVSKKMGFVIDDSELTKNVLEVCNKTKLNLSSMVQDIKRKVPTEIDYLNGVLIRFGNKVGIDTPYNQELFDQVKKIEAENGNN